jgi:hypothetical protein
MQTLELEEQLRSAKHIAILSNPRLGGCAFRGTQELGKLTFSISRRKLPITAGMHGGTSAGADALASALPNRLISASDMH